MTLRLRLLAPITAGLMERRSGTFDKLIGHYCANYYLNNFLPGTCRDDRNQTFFAFLFCECASGFLFIIVRYIGTAAFTGTSPVCSFAKGLPFGHSLISYLSVRTEGHKIGLGWVLL